MVQCFIKPEVLGIVLYWLSGIDGKTLQFTFNSHLKVMSVHHLGRGVGLNYGSMFHKA